MQPEFMLRFILHAALSCLLAACSFEDDRYLENRPNENVDTEKWADKLDSRIPSIMDELHIPGLALSVLKREQVLTTKCYGVRNSKEKAAVTEETVFEFASLSKPVFALAVLKLAQQGRIDLNKPLCEYLEKRNASHDKRYELITANIVLSHTTGFPNWAKGKAIQMAFTPGERFQYSGEGYFYLQKVIEKITGMTLQDIVEEQVFLPLGMTQSSFVWKDEFDSNMSYGHSNSGRVMRTIKKRWTGNSASSLVATVKDYATFVAYVLEEYEKGSPIILKMASNRVQVKDCGRWGKLFWGLGWGIEETKQGKSIWHWGNNGEFRSLVVANLDNGVGIIYVANSSNGLRPIGRIIENTVGGVHPFTKFELVY